MKRHLELVVLVSIIWGLNWSAVRITLDEIGPWTLRAGTLATASLLLLGIRVVAGRPIAIARRDWWRVFITSLTSVAGYVVLVTLAQQMAPTSRVAVIAFTMPLWATIFARLLLGERLDRRRVLGLGLGIVGLLFLAKPVLMEDELPMGAWLALLGGASWGLGIVLIKRLCIDAAKSVVVAWQLGAAAVMVGAGMLAFEGLPSFHALKPITVAAFCFQAFIGLGLATVVWFGILTAIPAGLAALGILLVPAIGLVSATLILGEQPLWSDYVGLALIVAASAAVLLRAAPAPAPAPTPTPAPAPAGASFTGSQKAVT